MQLEESSVREPARACASMSERHSFGWACASMSERQSFGWACASMSERHSFGWACASMGERHSFGWACASMSERQSFGWACASMSERHSFGWRERREPKEWRSLMLAHARAGSLTLLSSTVEVPKAPVKQDTHVSRLAHPMYSAMSVVVWVLRECFLSVHSDLSKTWDMSVLSDNSHSA